MTTRFRDWVNASLAALTGANVDVDLDKIHIVDASANASKYITPKELIANTSSFVQFGTGAVARTAEGKMREIVSFADFGVVGDGVTDDTVAIQKVLDLLAGDNLQSGLSPDIYINRGLFRVTDTLQPPAQASYFRMRGASGRSSMINWDGAAGIPVLKLINARGVTLEDFGINGNAGAMPSYLINFHQQPGHTVGTGQNKLYRLRLGGLAVDHQSAVGFTCDVGDDTNNEQMYAEEVEINNSNLYCYDIHHGNSLLHIIMGGSCYGFIGAAFNTYVAGQANGGSFTVFGTRIGGGHADSVVFNLMQPYHTIEVYGAHVEGTGKYFIKTNGTWNNHAGLSIFGGSYQFTDPGVGENTIDWNAEAPLLLHGVFIISANGIRASYQGGLETKISIVGGHITHQELRYAAHVRLTDVSEGSGAPTHTNIGGGILIFENSGWNGNNNMTQITAGATFSASGHKNNMIALNYGAPINVTGVTDGYVGQIITLYAANGNVTLINGGPADTFILNGAVNFAMAAANTITLRKMDAAFGNTWVEIGRKV